MISEIIIPLIFILIGGFVICNWLIGYKNYYLKYRKLRTNIIKYDELEERIKSNYTEYCAIKYSNFKGNIIDLYYHDCDNDLCIKTFIPNLNNIILSDDCLDYLKRSNRILEKTRMNKIKKIMKDNYGIDINFDNISKLKIYQMEISEMYCFGKIVNDKFECDYFGTNLELLVDVILFNYYLVLI